MDNKHLLRLVDDIYSLHVESIDCDDCDEQMDCLAELAAAGYDPKLLLPAVQKHFEQCPSCREAFRALLSIVKAEQSGKC